MTGGVTRLEAVERLLRTGECLISLKKRDLCVCLLCVLPVCACDAVAMSGGRSPGSAGRRCCPASSGTGC